MSEFELKDNSSFREFLILQSVDDLVQANIKYCQKSGEGEYIDDPTMLNALRFIRDAELCHNTALDKFIEGDGDLLPRVLPGTVEEFQKSQEAINYASEQIVSGNLPFIQTLARLEDDHNAEYGITDYGQ